MQGQNERLHIEAEVPSTLSQDKRRQIETEVRSSLGRADAKVTHFGWGEEEVGAENPPGRQR